MTAPFEARRCPCGHRGCQAWVINTPELRLDTQREAEMVAALLNMLNDGDIPPENMRLYIEHVAAALGTDPEKWVTP